MLPLMLTILGGVGVIVLESVSLRVFGVLVMLPELAVAAVVFVALRRSFSHGAAATLLFAAVADLCSGGPRGYYALGLTATFFAMTLVRERWTPRTGLGIALATIPAVVLTDAVALTSLALFRRGFALLISLLTVTPIVALLTALVTLPLAGLFVRLDRLAARRRRDSVALQAR